MRFRDHLDGRIAVFELSGKIMGGRDSTLFQGRVNEYVNINRNRILIDMAGVEWTNSRGLGMLIAALRLVQGSGGRLALTNIERVRSLLAVSRLATVFEHFDSRADALEALRSD
ncbi:MAG TPA: STAS domain-containing protein [candidate division Zixibacteria bacterium]|nr:STAS domain-containing protein [candidate division Zixibacteria bacterium]MDD4917627.1 STAS domain-containing protein [candidate division Zixibacteria bacterium]MDM7972114.1 STAS domain-containing protein [candidate division Zixibacteria bacterium]HOD65555.1 STAS domain-containing protein [candidate division Zixibacteria bacterium]HOZ08317.1 STAS domain-containing protein [candidate division Zixibacteria bacterium]